MDKCLLCKTGTLTKSGCHIFCSNCNFMQFSIDAEYMESALQLLGTVVSNTNFNTRLSFESFVSTAISDHTPKLMQFMLSIEDPEVYSKIQSDMVDLILTHAVNVQVSGEVLKPAPKDESLVCRCGSNKFSSDMNKSWNHISCDSCGDEYYCDDSTDGKYMPYFVCLSCNNTSYTTVAGTSNMVLCTHCTKTYLHDSKHGIFRAVLK